MEELKRIEEYAKKVLEEAREASKSQNDLIRKGGKVEAASRILGYIEQTIINKQKKEESC